MLKSLVSGTSKRLAPSHGSKLQKYVAPHVTAAASNSPGSRLTNARHFSQSASLGKVAKHKLVDWGMMGIWKPHMSSINKFKDCTKPMLRLILTEDDEKLGSKGEVVHVKRGLGRKMVLDRKATYAISENLQKWGIDEEQFHGSKGGAQSYPANVVKYLKNPDKYFRCQVPIDMPVFVTKQDIVANFSLRHGMHLPAHAISITNAPVEGVIKTPGDHTVEITINGKITVPIQFTVEQISMDECEEDNKGYLRYMSKDAVPALNPETEALDVASESLSETNTETVTATAAASDSEPSSSLDNTAENDLNNLSPGGKDK